MWRRLSYYCVLLLLFSWPSCFFNVNDETSLNEFNASLITNLNHYPREFRQRDWCFYGLSVSKTEMILRPWRPLYCPPQIWSQGTIGSFYRLVPAVHKPKCTTRFLAHYKKQTSAKKVINGRLSKNASDYVQPGAPLSSWIASVGHYLLYYDTTKWLMPIFV